jgi:hypothetical protein
MVTAWRIRVGSKIGNGWDFAVEVRISPGPTVAMKPPWLDSISRDATAPLG